MSEKNVKRPRLTCPADLPSFVRALWRNPANSHFLAKLERGQFSNLPVSSVEEAAAEARRLSASGADVYLACAEYKSHESRKASNVEAVWDFWIDADCGEAKAAAGTGHATFGIARDALSKCCAEIDIPEPTFVLDTGGGLHAHWALKTGLDPVRWKAIAEKFKKLMAARGLLADPSRTADVASVMRLPNTLNFKYIPPRQVKLVESREDVDTDAFCRAVEEDYARCCPAPVVADQPRAIVAMDRPHGPPDLDAIRTALVVLDPDCSEEDWRLRRIAPLARTARDHPELAEDLRALAMEWSSGVLREEPSRKWREPGGNGLTGEQEFDRTWNRFLQEEGREGVYTLATIHHDARQVRAQGVVIPGDLLGHVQRNFGLILQGGNLFVTKLINPDYRQIFIRERAGRQLIRRFVKGVSDEGDPGPIVNLFMDSPRTTLFSGVHCHPVEARPNSFNTWRGPTLQPKKGDCSRIKAFLLEIICSGDEDAYNYLIRYVAHALQKPEEKPGVKIVLGGGQGTGKGTVGRILARIWGDTYLHVHDVDVITGQFNAPLVRSFIVFLDEALFVGDRRVTNKLKALVTEPLVMINDKSVSQYQVDSFHRFVVASNEKHVQHTDRDDRRDFVLRVSDRHQGDAEYWTALYAEIEGGGTAAFMHELSQIDLSHFDVRRRPMTRALMDQKLQSLDETGRWWFEFLNGGCLEEFDTWRTFLSTVDILERVEKVSGVRRHGKLSVQEAVRRLRELCPSIEKAQKTQPGAPRRRGLILPPLDVARREFEDYMGGPIPWQEDRD